MKQYFSRVSLLLLLGLGIGLAAAQLPPTAPPLQAGTASLPAVTNPGSWTTVTFPTAFSTVPVVFTLVDETNAEPASVRVRNVTTTSFELAQVEAENNDGNTPAINVPWVAAEQGTYTLPDGSRIDVWTTDTSASAGWGLNLWNWQNGTYPGGNFAAQPTMMGKIQTANGEQNAPGSSCPWRQDALQSVTATGYQYALDSAEVSSSCANSTETLGFMAVDAGAAGILRTLDGQQLAYESITSGNIIDRHDDGCFQVNYANVYASTPVAVASGMTYNGNNGGWKRECAVSATSISLLHDEDQAGDNERTGIPEQAGIFVVGEPVVKLEKEARRIYDENGVLQPAGTVLLPGYTVGYSITYDVTSTGDIVIRDFFDTAEFAFIDTPTYNSTDPDASFTFDVGANGTTDQVLEWLVSGTGSITVWLEVQ